MFELFRVAYSRLGMIFKFDKYLFDTPGNRSIAALMMLLQIFAGLIFYDYFILSHSDLLGS